MKMTSVVLVVVLSVSLVLVGTTSSASYDPWIDLDDDGDIDIFDIVQMAGAYGTTGTPINKTELLLELQARLDALNATMTALVNQIDGCSGGVVNIKDCYGRTTGAGSGAVTVDLDNPFNSAEYYLFTRMTLAADFDPGSGNILAGTVVDARNVVKTVANFTVEVWYGEGLLKGATVDLFYIAIEMGITTGKQMVEGGEYDGEVQFSMVQTDPGAELVTNFSRPFTTSEAPELIATVVTKGAGDGLAEGAAIRAEEDVKGTAGNWYGFDLTVSKYGGGPLSNGAKVFVTWIAIGRASEQGNSPKECVVVTGSKPYNAPTPYASGTGFVINMSDSIPSGFTLVSAFATGRKTDLGGTTLDEPPLNLLPVVTGTSIEIRVWDAEGSEYDNWSNQRAHVDYTLFCTK